MELTGRCVLVTGGAHRVGKAIALSLARAGAGIVVITYHSSGDAAIGTINEIEALGVQALALRCDQSNVDQIQATIYTIQDKFGQLDVLVNSASIFLTADFFSVTVENWDIVMDTNARGPMFFMQYAASLLRLQGGCIINIIDESVKKPALAWIHHGAAKAALWNLTKAASIALAPEIRVNAVLPGAVLKPPDWSDERWEKNKELIPLHKLGSSQDVTRAVEFIIASDFMTGQAVVVDGGTTVL